ncbi:MAG TPA: helix-turn-helix transcriptional regulator [Planctomycetota bacterium]|nr:helix-turn-helix transcriptional regulator [Planctomycetota bacterium]
MKSKKPRRTTDAMEILYNRYLRGKPELIAEYEKIKAEDAIGRKIYELRQRAGLTQRELAKKIGTTASVICRLEDGDYDGHSMMMLNRIAKALNRRVEINFVPLRANANSIPA